jgi:serine/threonine-protein kinase HipA
MSTLAEVRLWGRTVGAVELPAGDQVATFEYAPGIVGSGIELSPLTMPLRERPYRFPALPRGTFHGLPGLLADALPDRFGNALIDAWLAGRGRDPSSFDAVERLCYTGRRGMGALEFAPVRGPDLNRSKALDVDALVGLAGDVLADREQLVASLAEGGRAEAMREILSVGTSAGGARAKALVAWNPTTDEVRSGQVDAAPGFEYWLLKFDGVRANRDKELADPAGFGAIEYAYFRMATAAGVDMMPCRLLTDEAGRRHFMTKRFDRDDAGRKIHAQTFGSLAHLDLDQARTHSYEQAFNAARRLGLPPAASEQLFRRMVFNVVARNQDDHVKNLSFLMNQRGTWSLSPAYDVTYSYQPSGDWTAQHQMSVNGRFDGFERADLRAVEDVAGLPRGSADRILDEVTEIVSQWRAYADDARVPRVEAERIARTHRLAWSAS